MLESDISAAIAAQQQKVETLLNEWVEVTKGFYVKLGNRGVPYYRVLKPGKIARVLYNRGEAMDVHNNGGT